MTDLGVLKKIDARKAWKHEALDFTPWLKDNISLLGSVLGMDLDLVESEVPVGPFAADLLAKDVSADRWVVIENQLAPTDHSHLGQLLTYGAGTEASVFVWISPEFREEHRAALDWLNEHSDEDSLFFGVEIELIVIDESKPAPNFRLVSSPNELTKTRRNQPTASGKGAAYVDFFTRVRSEFKEKYPGETSSSRTVQPQSWLPMGVGRSGFATHWVYTADKRFRVELAIKTGDAALNSAFFQRLRESKSEVERAIGHELDWDELPDRQTCRISSYYPVQPIEVTDEPEKLDALEDWAVDEMKRFRDALRPRVLEMEE